MDNDPVYRAFASVIKYSIIVSGMLALSVIALPILVPLIRGENYTLPDELKHWGGIILGFYFGSLYTIFGEVMRVRYGTSAKATREKPDGDLAAPPAAASAAAIPAPAAPASVPAAGP